MKLLTKPRERHYILGHEAFRLFAEHNPHQFFAIMSSENRQEFISEMVARVEQNCPNDTTQLNPGDFEVTLSSVENYPLVVIALPKPEAYVECFYIGILALVDMQSNDINTQPEIAYFTIELGETEPDKQGSTIGKMFCQWDEDTHYNLAELHGEVSVDEFQLLIAQRLNKQ
ncbi:MAG: hypothetical protein OQK04_16720 [Kangiellaceae bacterium]|nr:hypothetical protein [Kangiellaceae bacterium]MCW9000355.1 hypothetical protein [Kangiellaceae bacterium]